MNVDQLLASFGSGSYVVTRRSASVFVNGRAQPGPTSTLTIAANVQPASGNDLLRLPEARRTTETRTLYTSTQLYLGGQGRAYEADRVEIDGMQWEVQHLESWPGYFRCIVQVVA